ncbi:glycosyltransferase family 4 protein [Alcanivorax sp. JB21]|uniref:glycosyltransferase family 4 protein n=1 Tax=Alcanivorax limicola TaxID=2874102 RepID=UPI001CBB1455|nr:glycosyltransferase family 4 protein [Alcanivorax limicola]MBZ2188141.1 glycosyltransferase family 4 protein [Alcanivorax limicola]
MKLAYIFTAFPVRSQSFGVSELKSLDKVGCRVDIYRQEDKWPVEGFGIEGLSLQKIRLGEKLRSLFSPLFILMMLFSLKYSKKPVELIRAIILIPSSLAIARRIVSEEYDVIHLFWAHYPSLVAYAIKNLKKGETKFTTFCGAYDMTSEYGLSRWSTSNANAVITHCNASRDYLQEKWGVKSEVFYRGVNLPGNNARTVPKSKSRKVIVASRLIEPKRVDLAIDFFVNLKKVWKDAELNIYGDGPLRKDLEIYASKQGHAGDINFFGYISQDKLIGKFMESSVIILASESKSERLPNVIKEAMMVGCIPISSRSEGISELIADGEDGFIVDADLFRFPDVAKRVAQAIDEKEGEIRTRSRNKIVFLFNNELIAKRKVRLWKEVCNESA